MAFQHHSFPLCFSSIGMYEDFLIVITQFNNVLLYIGRETTFQYMTYFSDIITRFSSLTKQLMRIH